MNLKQIVDKTHIEPNKVNDLISRYQTKLYDRAIDRGIYGSLMNDKDIIKQSHDLTIRYLNIYYRVVNK